MRYIMRYTIRKPPLSGHHGCGFLKPSAFQQPSVLLSAVRPSAAKLFTSTRVRVIYHRHLSNFGSVTPPEIHKFQACFQGGISRGLQKAANIEPQINKHCFCEPLFFAIHSIRTLCFRSPKRSNFKSKIGTRSDLETNPKQIEISSLGTQKAFKTKSKNHPPNR